MYSGVEGQSRVSMGIHDKSDEEKLSSLHDSLERKKETFGPAAWCEQKTRENRGQRNKY